MSTNTTEMELENRTQSAIIWTNSNDSAPGCSLNASMYVIMPEDKEGLRDCSPCVLGSELDVSSNAKYLVNCMGINFSLLMLVVCQIICNSNSTCCMLCISPALFKRGFYSNAGSNTL